MIEKRAVALWRVLKAGAVEFPGGAFGCMVRNLSEQGAALDVAKSIRIPPPEEAACLGYPLLQ